MSAEAYFSVTYAQARDKFIAAAAAAGAEIATYTHPSERGPNGEALSLDVAWLGARDAKRVLTVGSGTHGIEGFAGSAAQIHWLASASIDTLPPDTAVAFFHAHNPWGFANYLRFTEHNVDLNRNFVDFTQPLPLNCVYPIVHKLIASPAWSEAALTETFEKLSELRELIGEQCYSNGFNGGQYSHADGIFYGGTAAEWSNNAFRQAVSDHLLAASDAAFVDLHTGIGPEDGHVFLCFHEPESDAYDRARSWWGERAVNREGVTHKAVAKYQGLLVDAFVDMLQGAETTAVVVEFGTRPRPVMQRASMAARYLFCHRDIAPALRESLQRDVREAFNPSEPAWRAGVVTQSKDIIDRALSGIASSD
ncbi:M14 family metallopeptidase [Chitinasiproducens palmae]|uniref:DUF2817 domain-containing protein n=1 Tax=Chitinasiproducens palmae TaxID=1770053 RepID=A0A1H2PN09_9BURK|nr:M14 family metallopeptidase [Chitinasiproducens palmae]SDV48045.1 Protein of unknown function [Chitinasiproducens palmae]